MTAASLTRAAPRPGRGRPRDVDRHVGARMCERRVALGLTQHRLAEALGIAYQQVHKYERGLNRVTAGRLFGIARALGVEPGYFFEGLGEGEPAQHLSRPRQLLELTRSFAALSRPQQEALCALARALAGAEVAPA